MRGVYSTSVYRKSPVGLQNAFLCLKGTCYSAYRRWWAFEEHQRQVRSNEFLSKGELEVIQLATLRQSLASAGKFVPYYNRLFKEIDFDPNRMERIEDLSAIPFLDKQMILSQPEEFVATNANKLLTRSGWTSGSTGKKLLMKMDRAVSVWEGAFADRQYRWAGASSGSRMAIVRGDLIVPADVNSSPYWRYDAFNKQMWFSSYHISDATILDYAEALREFDPEIIYAYPSSIVNICQLLESRGISLHFKSLKGVVTSSEMLLEGQRNLIQRCLGVRVFDWYGHLERTIFIGTCEEGSYHIFPDYGVTELIPAGVDDGGEAVFELVGTGFINKVMPLVRYRTGDLVTLDSNGSCECGRHFPRVRTIKGRINDVVVTGSGRRVGMLEFAFDNEFVRTGQIIQESFRHLTVLIVPEPGCSEQARATVVKDLRERVGDDMELDVRLVEAIPRDSSGKSRMVISRLAQG